MDLVTLALAKKGAKQYTDNVVEGLGRGITYKGAVNYYNDLPNDASIGDCYIVLYKGTSGNTPLNLEYIWGTISGQESASWNQLGLDASNFEDTNNKVTSLSAENTDIQYPSAKAVYDNEIALKTKLERYKSSLVNELGSDTDTGTDLTLDKTAEFDVDLGLSGNTSQETTTGKNKLGYNPSTGGYNGVTYKINDDGTITFNGTCTANNTILLNLNTLGNLDLTSLQAGSTLSIFYVSGSISGGTTQYRIYNSNYSTNLIVDFSNLSSDNPLIFASRTSAMTPNSNNCNLRVNNGCTFDNLTIKIMLTETEDTEYERYTNGASPNPEYPQDIQVVKGSNEFLIQNKNLFKEWKSGTINPDTGETSSYARNLSDFIQVKPSTQYSLWRENTGFATYTIEFDKNKNWLAKRTLVSSQTQLTFTTNANAKYVRLYQYTTYSPTNKAQLEPNTVTTSYIEHKEQTYPITLPEGMEMCKIGNYADEFVEQNNTWYKNPKIIKFILDGTENWQSATSIASGTLRFYYDNSNIAYADSDVVLIISNSFVGTTWNAIYTSDRISKNLIAPAAGASRVVIRIDENIANSVENLKTYLSQRYQQNNPVIAYGVLATSILEPIEDTTLIKQLNNIKEAYTYQGQTNISQTNEELPFIITADFKLSNLSRIEALEQAIN